MNDFGKWLLRMTEAAGLDLPEVARLSTAAGYPISYPHLWKIANGERKASAETCIAIAAALRIPRETVFKARGFLLTEPQEVVPPGTSPEVTQLARRLEALPDDQRRRVARLVGTMLDIVTDASIERDLTLLGTGNPELWEQAHREEGISTPPRAGRGSNPPAPQE